MKRARRGQCSSFCNEQRFRMKVLAQVVVVVVLLLVQSVAASAADEETTTACLGGASKPPFYEKEQASLKQQEQQYREDNSHCGLYMAESTIPNAGLGVFVGRAAQAGWPLSFGDVALQVEDFQVNNKLRRWFHRSASAKKNNNDAWLLDEYYWDGSTTPGASFDAIQIDSILPGIGMLANSHPGLVNARRVAPRKTADFHRSRDVGAGASTTHHNSLFVATTGTGQEDSIEPGTEIFIDYGKEWFKLRTAQLGDIPLGADYETADQLLQKFYNVTNGNVDTLSAKQTWELLQQSLRDNARVAAAMPTELKDVACAIQTGTARRAHPDRYRSFEWLEKHGQCLDNIRPGPSLIDQAGGGAFATRSLQTGQVIAPMPMVHLRRHQLEIYDSPSVEQYTDQIERVGMQLLLNYAYGHPESSLLLFPMSPVVNYVNHNATGFNAELRWSARPSHKTSWLLQTPDNLQTEKHAGLIMEMVATRDIKAHEEVVLDYGAGWDTAWKGHVAQWSPTQEDSRYVSATALNHNVRVLKTRDELEKDAEAKDALATVHTVCFLQLAETQNASNGAPQLEWQFQPALKERTKYAHACDVVQRTDPAIGDTQSPANSSAPNAASYTVVLKRKEGDNVVLAGIPRDAIQFVDKRYTADQFLRKAFRHEIGLPEHLLPLAWRDIPPQSTALTLSQIALLVSRTAKSMRMLPLFTTIIGAGALFVAHRRRKRVVKQVVWLHYREPSGSGLQSTISFEDSAESPTRQQHLLRHRSPSIQGEASKAATGGVNR